MKGESLKSWIFRVGMNWYPMFFGTGGKITFLQHDFKKSTLRLKLNIWTYNYVGTIFGGSQFSALDPFHMVLLINILGKGYVVLDKAGSIQFKRPGKGVLTAEVSYSEEELAEIRKQVAENGRLEIVKSTDWINAEGQVVSTLQKTLYIATREHHISRRKSS